MCHGRVDQWTGDVRPCHIYKHLAWLLAARFQAWLHPWHVGAAGCGFGTAVAVARGVELWGLGIHSHYLLTVCNNGQHPDLHGWRQSDARGLRRQIVPRLQCPAVVVQVVWDSCPQGLKCTEDEGVVGLRWTWWRVWRSASRKEQVISVWEDKGNDGQLQSEPRQLVRGLEKRKCHYWQSEQ